jgi:hypothetical protein
LKTDLFELCQIDFAILVDISFGNGGLRDSFELKCVNVLAAHQFQHMKQVGRRNKTVAVDVINFKRN